MEMLRRQQYSPLHLPSVLSEQVRW
uniref:Uncharacterized protein n=1 Tax=Rhizophora mucronata TaxID=61149 RepID=A0A2P2ISD6_RHIMU